MKIGYVRVSTVEQSDQRQIEELGKQGIEKWFIEKISAKDMKRPKLKAMLEFARKGDTIFIKDFSRLARSTRDLLEIIEQLERKEVALISISEKLDTSTTTGKLLITMIGAINEFERANMLERQREGIAIAKREGKFKGRKPMKINQDKFNDLKTELEKGYITKTEMAQRLGISRGTLYNRLKKEQKSI